MGAEQPGPKQPAAPTQVVSPERKTGDAWGDPISAERAAELRELAERQSAWVDSAPDGERDLEQSATKDIRLSGADVFWLATYVLAGAEGDLNESAAQLRSESDNRYTLDLSLLHLEGAILRGAQLPGAGLYGAQLQRFEAQLQGADLSGSQLQGANLTRAQLQRATLREARLQGAHLFDAQLQGADLFEAQLQGADLRGSQLQEARLRGAQLQGADLTWAQLQGARLSGAQLQEARLSEAQLQGAYLGGAWLQGAILISAQLQGAYLVGAQLQGADLTRAQLERADLHRAALDGKTALAEAHFLASEDDRSLPDRLFRRPRYGPALGDVHWGDFDLVQLTQLDGWDDLRRLTDERGLTWRSGVGDHRAAVRAYRQVAQRLRDQGFSDVADRLSDRAQVLQRKLLFRLVLEDWRRPWQLPGDLVRWLFSWFLALLAGYGYHPGRSVFWYLTAITSFTLLYMQATRGWIPFGLPAPSQLAPLPWYEALILSVSSFHGRGFFQPLQSLGDPVAALAAIEAVIGLLIEISFIATFTQRFFGAK
jgi:uncharacterized protein YjbI with pentapeptide repeats